MLVSNQQDCYHVVLEALGLFEECSPHGETMHQVHLLIQNFFEDERFRRLALYNSVDQPGDASIQAFNEKVIIPMSSFRYKLVRANQPILINHHFVEYEADPGGPVWSAKQSAYDLILHALDAVLFARTEEDRILIQQYYTKPSNVKNKWKNRILGMSERACERKFDKIPPLHVLFSRINLSLDKFVELKRAGDPRTRIFSYEQGSAWIVKENAERATAVAEQKFEQAVVDGSSAFADYFAEVVAKSGKTLDQLAGVEIAPHNLYPEVIAQFERLLREAPKGRVEKVDLKKNSKRDAGIGGTVVGFHQLFSPQFLAYFSVDHDVSCKYMTDIRTSNKKHRKIRISSTQHTATNPIWLQFGEGKDVVLYLSQKASAAEEAWLKVANYVTDELVKFVNKYLLKIFGPGLKRKKLMRTPKFETNVCNASRPDDGKYGEHRDAKPGLVDISRAKFGDFYLMVPTFCLQNHLGKNAVIEWLPLAEPTFVAGKLEQELCLFHFQMYNVNKDYKHRVSFPPITRCW
jgi:hypothetical protein